MIICFNFIFAKLKAENKKKFEDLHSANYLASHFLDIVFVEIIITFLMQYTFYFEIVFDLFGLNPVFSV